MACYKQISHQKENRAMCSSCDCQHEPQRPLDRRALFQGIALTALSVALPGCVTNPETGRSQLLLVDDAQLATMAVDVWSQTKAKTPISKDASLNQRLVNIGRKIQVAAGRGGEQWEFVVFDTAEKNAFVLPGGKVGMYKGLMQMAENDSQIAAVLGHETGHVTAHHAAERASQQMAAQVAGSVASSVLKGSTAAGIFGMGAQYGVLMPYARTQESEADILGVDYMHRAGYDVRQAVRLWELMAAGGGSRPPQILSTHPDPLNRIENIKAHIRLRGYAQI
jgi:predicted Zn-dependent protease